MYWCEREARLRIIDSVQRRFERLVQLDSHLLKKASLRYRKFQQCVYTVCSTVTAAQGFEALFCEETEATCSIRRSEIVALCSGVQEPAFQSA